MRAIQSIAGAVLTLAVAGVAFAATPSPTPSPKPTATPAPAATPAPSASPAPGKTSTATPAPGKTPTTTTSATSWSAAIKPLDVVTGSASVARNKDGTGIITVTLRGLRPDLPWLVDIDSGTSTSLRDAGHHEIATRSGRGLDKVSSDTVRIHLTAAEMKAFAQERAAGGAVVVVTDGTNRSAAVFAAG